MCAHMNLGLGSSSSHSAPHNARNPKSNPKTNQKSNPKSEIKSEIKSDDRNEHKLHRLTLATTYDIKTRKYWILIGGDLAKDLHLPIM